VGKQLWRTMLVVNFGQGASRPLQAALLRICAASAAATILGVATRRTLEKTHLPLDVPADFMGALTVLATYGLIGLLLLSLGSTRLQAGQSTFTRLLATLPLSRTTRWLLPLAPSAIVCLLSLIIWAPVTYTITKNMKLPAAPSLIWMSLGAASAIGFTVLTKPKSVLLKVGLFACSMVTGILLIQRSAQTADHRLYRFLLACIYAIAIVPLVGFLQSYFSPPTPSTPRTRDRQLLKLPSRHLLTWWFLLKLLRNRRSVIPIMFSFSIASALAYGLAAKHLTAVGGVNWLLIGAVLTTAIACDIRGLSPRHKAPEVEALSGPRFFVRGQTRSALLVAFIPPLPILVALLGAHTSPAAHLIEYFICLQLAALLIGLLASSMFVPRAGETGAQFFSVMLSTTILGITPKLLHFQNLNLLRQSLIWLSLAICSYMLIHIIEHTRRLHYVAV
jgi:hypothetical protein